MNNIHPYIEIKKKLQEGIEEYLLFPLILSIEPCLICMWNYDDRFVNSFKVNTIRVEYLFNFIKYGDYRCKKRTIYRINDFNHCDIYNCDSFIYCPFIILNINFSFLFKRGILV